MCYEVGVIRIMVMVLGNIGIAVLGDSFRGVQSIM